jgi:hypothetical protein
MCVQRCVCYYANLSYTLKVLARVKRVTKEWKGFKLSRVVTNLNRYMSNKLVSKPGIGGSRL